MTGFGSENFRNVFRRKGIPQAPSNSSNAAGSSPSTTTRRDPPPSEPYNNRKKSSRRTKTTGANKDVAVMTTMVEKVKNQNVPQNGFFLSGEPKSSKPVLVHEEQSSVPSSPNISSEEDYSYSRLMEMWSYRDQHLAKESKSTAAKQQQPQKKTMTKQAVSQPSFPSPTNSQERPLPRCPPPLKNNNQTAKSSAPISLTASQLMPSLMDDDESTATSDGGTVTAHIANRSGTKDSGVTGSVNTVRNWMNKLPPLLPTRLLVGHSANTTTRQSIEKTSIPSKKLKSFGNFHNSVMERVDEEDEFDAHFNARTFQQAKRTNVPQQQALQTETRWQVKKTQTQQTDHNQHFKHQVILQQNLRKKLQRQIDEDNAETDQTGTVELAYDESLRQQDREHSGIFILPATSLLDTAGAEKSEISLPFDESWDDEFLKAGVDGIKGMSRLPIQASNASGGNGQIVIGHSPSDEDSKYAIHDVIRNDNSMAHSILANSGAERNGKEAIYQDQINVIRCRDAKSAFLAANPGEEAEQERLEDIADPYMLHQTMSTAHSAVTVQVRNNGRRKSIAIGDDDSDIDGQVDRIMSQEDDDQMTESDIFEGVSSIHDSAFGIGEVSMALLDSARQSSPVLSTKQKSFSAQNGKASFRAAGGRDEKGEGDDNYINHLMSTSSRPPRCGAAKPKTLQRHLYQQQQRAATKLGPVPHVMSASSGSDVFDGLDSDVASSTGNDIDSLTDAGTFMNPFRRTHGGEENFILEASKQNNREAVRAPLQRTVPSPSIFKKTELRDRLPQGQQTTNRMYNSHAHDDDSSGSFSDIDNDTLFANLNDMPKMTQTPTQAPASRMNAHSTPVSTRNLRIATNNSSTTSSASKQNYPTQAAPHAQTKKVVQLSTPSKQHIAPTYGNPANEKAPINKLFSVNKSEGFSVPMLKESTKNEKPGSTIPVSISSSKDLILAAPTNSFPPNLPEIPKANLSANAQNTSHAPSAKEAISAYTKEKGSRATDNTTIFSSNERTPKPADKIVQATTEVAKTSAHSFLNLSRPTSRVREAPNKPNQLYSVDAKCSRLNQDTLVKGHASVDMHKLPINNCEDRSALASRERTITTTPVRIRASLPLGYSCQTKQTDSGHAKVKTFESTSLAEKNIPVAGPTLSRPKQAVSEDFSADGGKFDQKTVDVLWSAKAAVQVAPTSGRRSPSMTCQLHETTVEKQSSSVHALPPNTALSKEEAATSRPLSMKVKEMKMQVAFTNEASDPNNENGQDDTVSKESTDDENDCSLYRQDDELMHHLLHLKSTTPPPIQVALNTGEHVVLKSAADFAMEQSDDSDSQVYNHPPPRKNCPEESLLARIRWAPSMARLYKYKTTHEAKKCVSDKRNKKEDQKSAWDKAGDLPSFRADKKVDEAELKSESSTGWSERSPDPRVTPKASSPRSVMNEVTPAVKPLNTATRMSEVKSNVSDKTDSSTTLAPYSTISISDCELLGAQELTLFRNGSLGSALCNPATMIQWALKDSQLEADRNDASVRQRLRAQIDLWIRNDPHRHSDESRHMLRNAVVCHCTALDHIEKGCYAEGLDVYEDFLRKAEDGEFTFQDDSEFRQIFGTMMHNIATINLRIGAYDVCVDILDEAVAVRRDANSELGVFHRDVAVSLNEMGLAYFACQHFEEALKVFADVLHIWQEMRGVEHFHITRALINIGATYFALAEPEAALEACEEALEVHRSTLLDWDCNFNASGNHPSIQQMASSYNAPSFIRGGSSLDTEKSLVGISNTLCNMAYINASIEEMDEAGLLLEEALFIQTTVFGENHERTLATSDLLARALRTQSAKRCS